MPRLQFEVKIKPVGKARPRAGVHGFYTPKKTADYEALIAGAALEAMKQAGLRVADKPVSVTLRFTFEPPKSWTKAARMAALAGMPHTSKPDGDNLEKAVLDAMNGVVYRDDCLVWQSTRVKMYGAENSVHVSLLWED